MDQELVQYLDGRFNGLASELDRRFNTVNERIEEVKRHTGILVEGLRYEVRLVAEGFAVFVEGRYTQDQASIAQQFQDTRALIHSS